MNNPFEPDLEIDSVGGVRIVTFCRPDSLNAVTAPMHAALARVWGHLAADPAARAVLVTGRGRAFSAGGDLEHIVELQADVAVRQGELAEARQIANAMIECPLPIVAAVNGPAIGLGCSVALLCDLVYMAESAYLADPHVAIGLTAGDGGAAVWPVLASMVQAKEYLLTGDRIGAADAYRMGLVTRVVPDAELFDTALAMAERLAGLPAQAVASTKRAVNLHLSRAVLGVMDYALAAEYQSFDTPEHRSVIARMRARAADREAGR